MAKNLRARMPEGDTLLIHDRNTEATSKFIEEVGIAAASVGADRKGQGIEIVNTPRALAEKSVSAAFYLLNRLQVSCDEYVVSMIQVGGCFFAELAIISQDFVFHPLISTNPT